MSTCDLPVEERITMLHRVFTSWDVWVRGSDHEDGHNHQYPHNSVSLLNQPRICTCVA